MTRAIRALMGFSSIRRVRGNVQAGGVRDPDECFFDQTFGDLREELQIRGPDSVPGSGTRGPDPRRNPV